MPMVFTCGGCKKKLRIPDTLVGKPVKCPGCARKLNTTPKPTVPANTAAVTSAQVKATPKPSESKPEAAPKKPAAAAKKAVIENAPPAAASKKHPAAKSTAPAGKSSKPTPAPSSPASHPSGKRGGMGKFLLKAIGGAVAVIGAVAVVIFAIWYFMPEPEVGILTGTVTFDGVPVASAKLEFIGADDRKLASFSEVCNLEGIYATKGSGEGRPIGKYKVLISKQVKADGQQVPLSAQSGKDGNFVNLLPPHYNDASTTDLTAVIAAGDNEPNNFELKSQP